MKKAFLQLTAAVCLVATLSFTACKSGPKDSDIQDNFNAKLRENPQLRTVTATVNEGVITLSGPCPDEACRTSAEQAARDIEGVKNVVNNITVSETAPVVVADDGTLQKAVDEIADRYDGVEAKVENSEIFLRGSIERDKLQQLMMDMNTLNVKVNNQLNIK